LGSGVIPKGELESTTVVVTSVIVGLPILKVSIVTAVGMLAGTRLPVPEPISITCVYASS
jgi:hypothetical protein